MKGLSKWLRARRDRIVRKMELLESRWDQTYGPQDPVPTTVEVVDFDQLMQEIEAFEKSFKEKP